jgi:hypothetical protein
MKTADILNLLIGAGAFSVLASVGSAALAKFLPREKLADMLWGATYNLLGIIDKLLDLKVGNKAAELIEESILGTLAYVAQSWGTRLTNWLRLNDTDKTVTP